MRSESLKQFKSSWSFVRSMTIEFVRDIPEPHWMTNPHPEYSPFAKQVRHMVWVSGLYNDALKNFKIDLKNKKTCYEGSLVRADLLAALKRQDEILFGFLENLSAAQADSYQMDFFGGKTGLYEFLNNMIQHEAMHHGIWSLYSKLGGFPNPASWKNNWEL